MEVCDQVQAINIVLREKDIPLHVFIEPRRISTQSYNGSVTVYPLTIEVDPSSCSSMKYKSQEGISMRLQVKSVEEVPPAYVPMGTLVERLGDAFERLNGRPCSCGCKACGINLLKKDVKFTRVLSLPSNNWEDMSSSWTCCSHKHGFASDPDKLKLDDYPFVPRIGECYENEFFIIFYPKAVVRNNVLLYPPAKSDTSDKPRKYKYEKSLMKCGRCLAIVGEALIIDSKTVRTYNFYKSAVEFRSFYEKFPQPIFNSAFFLERVLANEISNEAKTNATYRFILQDERKNPYLLLRVLSADTRVRFHQPPCQEFELEGLDGVFGASDAPRRYIGSEEWELAVPKVLKKEKEKALKESKKLLQKVLSSLHTIDETLPEVQRLHAEEMHIPDGTVKKLISPDVWALYLFSPNCLPVGRTCEEGAVDDAGGLERVVKVMYISATTSPGLRLAKDWQKDINVRVITFPYSLCMDSLLVLATSTLSLPISRRVAPEEFLFGILRLE